MRVSPLAIIFHVGAAAFAILALGPGLRAATTGQASFSGNNFEFPGFGADGYKVWDMQGNFNTTSADNAPVDIKNMKLHLYSGGPALALETTIESPQATVLTGQSQARGSDQLDIIGSNNTYEVTGYDWSWDGKSQVILVGRSVRVTFTAMATASANPTAKPSQPVIIVSDKLEIHQEPRLNRFLFSGNILVTDGNCQTKCDALEVLADRSGPAKPAASAPPPVNTSGRTPEGLGVGHIEHIVASNHVVTTQGYLEARGDTAELFPGDQRVVLSGSPQVRESSSDALLEGGQIVWWRDREEVDVEPIPDLLNGPGRVRVTLPPLTSYQESTDHPPSASEGAPRLVITGESLHGQFGATQRRFDIEKSVRVEDPSLNVTAEHLDAEFDPPTPDAAITPNLLPGAPVPQVGRLNHLATNGGVTIEQFNRTTTTQQAEILPGKGEILLTGAPHVLDTLSHTTIDGNRLELSTDGRKAVVTGVAGQPARIILASLPGISDTTGTNLPTTVVGDTVTMERGDEYSNFTFAGRVHVSARDLEATCDTLDAYTHNLASASSPTVDALETTGQLGEIQELIARGFVEITQRRANAGQSDYRAHAARAEIYPQVGVNDEASGPAEAAAPQRRSVELFGDPDGVQGPVRPEVEMPPMQNLGIVPVGSSTATAPAVIAPTLITSDQQWLITGPAGSTYYFEGNVQIDGGSFEGSCDKMRAQGTPAKNADGSNATGPVILERVIAEDHVRITQGTRVSTAGKAVLLPHEGKVELSENAVVVNSADGSRLENADLELTKGEVVAVPAPAASGQPIVRPTIILPSKAMNFDKVGKPADKPSAGALP